jgi:hypothetical protein
VVEGHEDHGHPAQHVDRVDAAPAIAGVLGLGGDRSRLPAAAVAVPG